MIVERKNNEIVVRISANTKASKIQSILDYLRYEELTAESTATQEDVDKLVKEAKKGRWERIKRKA
ncbi:MAG: hypothetical protein K9I68_06715 [Bacteroidales bacterium]|nr:hypothetical protein [Bacteroidales bacterium]MCF8337305.1 hypothetical protein [Bacteroidales bacterium]